jgi:hypothetical protein
VDFGLELRFNFVNGVTHVISDGDVSLVDSLIKSVDEVAHHLSFMLDKDSDLVHEALEDILVCIVIFMRGCQRKIVSLMVMGSKSVHNKLTFFVQHRPF